MTKVLIVVTNHADLGDTGNKTGWYLPEVAHPYDEFIRAGCDVTFVSPKGGKAPMDPGSYDAFKDDPSCKTFFETKMSLCDNTKSPQDINASDYKVIFYAGGHGPMYDLPGCDSLAKLGAEVYEKGGVVGAVCHGTVGLVPIKLSNGELLLKGKTVTSFTNDEENYVNLMSAMPFALETKLKDCGAKFVGKANFTSNVQVDGRVITGQNPASATPTAKAIVEVLK